jgi:hypothetical protein
LSLTQKSGTKRVFVQALVTTFIPIDPSPPKTAVIELPAETKKMTQDVTDFKREYPERKGYFMKRLTIHLTLSIIFILIFQGAIHAYPSQHWRHIKADGFIVSYNEETVSRVDEVIRIAQETALTVGAYFGHEITSEPIAIALSDHYDDTQGETYFRHDLIRLDIRKTELSLFRGETEQLRTLISHELAHLYSLRLIKSKWYLNAGVNMASDDSIGWLYTSSANTFIPQWFIEGIAQMGSYQFKADFRDPYREMLLRDAFMNNRLLSPDRMAIFEGTSREYELVYNQGFDFMLFLSDRYGDGSMKSLCGMVREKGFKKGFETFYGKSVENLYAEWVGHLTEKYAGEYDKPNGEKLYPLKRNALTIELYSVGMGKAIIANWDHDYNRYDLYLMYPDMKRVRRKIEDTGMVVKRDPWDGSLYFNRSVYNRKSGVDTFDIYRLKPDGTLTRETRNKRCLAFDVKEGHLLYAAYEKGKTTLIHRYPDGLKKYLIQFGPDTAIFHLSMIDAEHAVVSMGTGDYKRVAMLKDQRLTPLWEGLEVDVLEAVYGENGRLIFTSTLNGSPQVYWCDMDAAPELWYQLTNVAGGARFPSLEKNDTGEQAIMVSMFENGDHHRYRLQELFSKENAIPLSIGMNPPVTANAPPQPSRESSMFTKERLQADVGSNVVYSLPSLNMTYQSMAGDSSSASGQTGLYSIGTTFDLLNAPENSYELNGSLTLNHATGFDKSDLQYLSGNLTAGMDLHHFHLTAGIGFDTSYIEEDDDLFSTLYEISRREIQTTLSYQLFSDDFLSLSLAAVQDDLTIDRTIDGGDSLKGDMGAFYKARISTLTWRHITTQSKFDPAGVGAPYVKSGLQIAYHENAYPAYRAQEESDEPPFEADGMHYHDTEALRFSGEIAKRSMVAMNRMSLHVVADGFFWDGGIREKSVAMYTYDYLGSEEYFSGYSYYLTRVRKSFRGLFEVRVNPFV